MNNKWIILIAIALALPASAESVFKDGPHLAYPYGGNLRHSELGFGWQVTYERSSFWSLDLSITRQTDKLDDLGVLEAPFEDRFDLELFATTASLRFTYPMGMTTLYAGGGMGYYYLRTDNKKANRSLAERSGSLPVGINSMRVGVDPENTFGYHAALGVERLLSPSWEVFAEYRWVWLDTTLRIRQTESRGGLQRNTIHSRDSLSYDHGLIRAGVNYRF